MKTRGRWVRVSDCRFCGTDNPGKTVVERYYKENGPLPDRVTRRYYIWRPAKRTKGRKP